MLINNGDRYKYNVRFEGKVDKSVINYLKITKKDVIKTKGDPHKIVAHPENIDYATEAIPRILDYLKMFMNKTSKNTKLVLEGNDNTHNLYLMFKNSKTKAEIRGFAPATFNSESPMVSSDGINIPKPYLTKKWPKNNWLGFFGLSHTSLGVDSLKELDKWTTSLIKRVEPKKIDEALAEVHLNNIKRKEQDALLKQAASSKRKAENDQLKNKILNLKKVEIK